MRSVSALVFGWVAVSIGKCFFTYVPVICAYLECGINNGEPIDGGGIVGVGKSVALLTAAVSGCKKFRR